MKVISQRGDYTRVPDTFVIAFWASADHWVLHGEPYQVTSQYHPDMFNRIKALCKEKKSNTVGFAEPMKMKDGKRYIVLFSKAKHYDSPHPQDVRNALKTMWNILKPRPALRKVSMHVPYDMDTKTFVDLLEDELGETDLQVLVRRH